MVEHAVEHELVACLEGLDVFPCSETGVHGLEVYDGKAPVRAVGKKGQYVQGVDGPFQVAVTEFCQGGQGRRLPAPQKVSVGDEDHVPLREALFRIGHPLLPNHLVRLVGVIDLKDAFQFRHDIRSVFFSVEESQPPKYPLPCIRRDPELGPSEIGLLEMDGPGGLERVGAGGGPGHDLSPPDSGRV